jgi:hypothetical protein
VRGWESQRSSAPLYPRGSITGSQGEQDGGRPTEEDFGEAMQVLRPGRHRPLLFIEKWPPHSEKNLSGVYQVTCLPPPVRQEPRKPGSLFAGTRCSLRHRADVPEGRSRCRAGR